MAGLSPSRSMKASFDSRMSMRTLVHGQIPQKLQRSISARSSCEVAFVPISLSRSESRNNSAKTKQDVSSIRVRQHSQPLHHSTMAWARLSGRSLSISYLCLQVRNRVATHSATQPDCNCVAYTPKYF